MSKGAYPDGYSGDDPDSMLHVVLKALETGYDYEEAAHAADSLSSWLGQGGRKPAEWRIAKFVQIVRRPLTPKTLNDLSQGFEWNAY